MKTKYKVTEECINCRACVEVSEKHFAMNDSDKAFVKLQPKTEAEVEECESALEVCPVGAIIHSDKEEPVKAEVSKDDVDTAAIVDDIFGKKASAKQPILATSNIKEVLDKHEELKDVLIALSPKFRKMQSPVLYKTLARFATFKDAAKITGISICEILHSMNAYLGLESELLKAMPECVKNNAEEILPEGEDISWEESPERYILNDSSREDLVERISNLGTGENIVILSVDEPGILIKVAQGLNYKFNIEKGREYRLSIYNANDKTISANWEERKDEFEILDVRSMQSDPFDIILKKAYDTAEDDGFILIQKFDPIPLINMLSEMGFDHVSEEKGPFQVWVYFHKKVSEKVEGEENIEKPDVVIQSATPVAYPIIMRLLQSEKVRKSVNIKELKVWEETEKHLGWIINGKADISFSALITSVKLRQSDVKIPAIFVWDNFVMLARGYKASQFKDVKGHDIATPLFEEAPPAKISKYLLKASGENPEEYNFTYGKPFGRPEKIYSDFVTGKADTVILREPEASYAVKIMEDRKEDFSEISYNKLWNEVNPGFGSFPNAGIVFKGEFARNNPELSQVLLEELKEAIDWVNNNQFMSAKLSYDMMRQPVDRVEKFLSRVNFNYVEGDELVSKVKTYFDILTAEGIVETKVDDDFYKLFKL
jgi:NitT/TauT family transport system substrate-binding protein